MADHPPLIFAAIGLDHRHIYHQVGRLLDLGARCAGYHARDEAVPLEGFVERFPDLTRVADPRVLLEDAQVQLIVCAGIPGERAAIAIQAMRHGKDVMVDKPGVITAEQLDAVRAVQQETGQIWSVNFSERFEVRAMTRAQELVRAGALGRVVQTVGFGPHRLNRHLRPPWFFERAQGGGILADIASHQVDQFLVFTGSDDAAIVASAVANYANPENPDSRTLARSCCAAIARAATSGSTGTPRTGCPPGATDAARSSAPRATSSSGSTSTSPAATAPITCSWSTARRPATSTAGTRPCPTTSA